MAINKQKCPWCKNDFEAPRWRKRAFCSKRCSLLFRNKHENPSKTEAVKKKLALLRKKDGAPWLNTQESKKKRAKTITGKGHWNWQGGKTPENKRRRNLTEAHQWRTAVFERDNYTCQECGARTKKGRKVTLNADHIKPWSLYPELRLDIKNGRTLCVECHKKTPTYMGRIKRYSPATPPLKKVNVFKGQGGYRGIS